MGAGYNEGDAMKNHMLHRLAVSVSLSNGTDASPPSQTPADLWYNITVNLRGENDD